MIPGGSREVQLGGRLQTMGRNPAGGTGNLKLVEAMRAADLSLRALAPQMRIRFLETAMARTSRY